MATVIVETQEETRTAVLSSEDDHQQEDDMDPLSDMPLLHNSPADSSSKPEIHSPESVEEFEFQTTSIFRTKNPSKLHDSDMSTADELFFQGQILPLRPSFTFSRSQSMDRTLLLPSSSSSSSTFSSSSSSTFSSSSSSSVSSSSSRSAGLKSSCRASRSKSTVTGTISRNQYSTASSVSSNFYSHPSPKLHLLTRKVEPSSQVPRRRSTSSSSNGNPSGWGIFRLGLVRGPELELLHDIKQRKPTGAPVGGSKRYELAECRSEKKVADPPKESEKKQGGQSKLMKLLFRKRFRTCKFFQGEAVEPISSSSPSTQYSKLEKVTRMDEDVRCLSSRTFQWLEELSLAKPLYSNLKL